MPSDDVTSERRELLSLRARVVVLERAVLAAMELTLRIRPEDLQANLETARRRLSTDYETESFASDITDDSERRFLAHEVEQLMKGIQADMGFPEGVSIPDNG